MPVTWLLTLCCPAAAPYLLRRSPAPRPQRTAPAIIESLRGRLHHVIFDCPDPRALAAFYSTLLHQPITYATDEFVVVADRETNSGLACQLAPSHRE